MPAVGRTLLAMLLPPVLAVCQLALVQSSQVSASDLVEARRLHWSGKYAEALEAYESLRGDQPVRAAIGQSACLRSTGQRDRAAAVLQAAIEQHGESAALLADSASLAFDRGDVETAQKQLDRALELDQNCIAAHWQRGQLLAALGQLGPAEAEFRWLVDRYNAGDVADADELRAIGLAAAQFARWNRLSDQFGFLVNDFYPDLLAAQPGYWPAQWEIGLLFAEKYNDAEASKAFKAAQTANANAAEIFTALGRQALQGFELESATTACERALAINAEYLPAFHLRADIHFANFDPRAAAGVLNDARKLNPVSEATLGRLAAAYLAVDGPHRRDPTTRFGQLAAAVQQRNPHAGNFYLALADALDQLRRWPAAADFYRQAMQQMPQLIEPPGRLGMMLMRLGEEDQGRQILTAAFEADPFNVRVNNTLKVLEVLQDYATLETEHFLIRYDPDKDRLTAKYMARWLEQVYPELVEQLGYAPPGKSLFEVFSRARNTDGHGWFSARMVGLPRIHPIGACAGKIVALKSPSEGDQQFNWARVLKHEFVHVVNLQQTDFNIPHWFTEGIAVLNEGDDRSPAWNDLLLARAKKRSLFNLDTINFGFIRPQSSDDWTLAYCQAELYAEYMLHRFGHDAIARMLAAYADNLDTPAALERAFGVRQADFEQGYDAYLANILATLSATASDDELSPVELQRALDQQPDDPRLLAQAAAAQLNRKNYPQARRQADEALQRDASNQLAHYVRARLHLLVGENREAFDRLEKHLDRQQPQKNLLALLAGLKLRAEDFAGAAQLYELGARHDPRGTQWHKSLAAVYLKAGDNEKLVPALEKLAALDIDDLTLRKKLAQLAVERKDWPAVLRWTQEGLHIQVLDANLHSWRAAAFLATGEPAQAAEHFGDAVELEPNVDQHALDQARALIAAADAEGARRALEALLRRTPNHAGAQELLKSLN